LHRKEEERWKKEEKDLPVVRKPLGYPLVMPSQVG